MPRTGYNPVAQAVRAIRRNSDLGLPPEVASALDKLERLEALAAETNRARISADSIIESIIEHEAVDLSAVATLELQPAIDRHLAEAIDRAGTRVFSLFRQHLNTILGTVRREFFDPALETLTEIAQNTDVETASDQAGGPGRPGVAAPCVDGEDALVGLRRARALIPAIFMEFPQGGARDITLLRLYKCPDIALEVLDDPRFDTELAQTLEIIRRGGGLWLPTADEIRAHRPVYERESLRRYVDADDRLVDRMDTL